MVENQTFSLMIQMVALFLPAWAIMVQIFARLMEQTDLDENPGLIPFFGVGLALTLVSIWMFGRAVMSGILSHMLERAQGPDPNPLLFQSMLDIMSGEIAFSSLGLIILFISGVIFFEKWNGVHILVTVLLTFLVMQIGATYADVVAAAWGIIFILFFGGIYSATRWPNHRDWLREKEDEFDRIRAG